MKNWYYGKHVIDILIEKFPNLIQEFAVVKKSSQSRDVRLKKFSVRGMERKTFDNTFTDFKTSLAVRISGFPEYSFKTLLKDIQKSKTPNKIVLILDHIQNPSNFGSIMRTAFACGVFGIIVPKSRTATINATIAKTSAGTIFLTKICFVSNLNSAIKELKKNLFWIVATTVEAKKRYYDLDSADSDLAVIVGNEGSGISQLLVSRSDFLVKIPMFSSLDSLNVGVATAIIIYEIRKKQNFWGVGD